jgi:hypothetical protein
MTHKAIQKYHKKGIFTTHQLSYLFKPRRNNKKRKITKFPLQDNLELQALAIRENKIYVQALPEISREKIELFLDIEGIPDEHFHYLIGLLVCQESACVYHSFWADTINDEEKNWNQLVSYINEYPEAPIYHYGNYELRAINELSRKYSTDVEAIKKRLVNINSYIYGKIYFPVLSNNLKKIGNFIGASWECKDASGLQSLVWRYEWEEVQSDKYKNLLIKYNYDDCNVLKLLFEKISSFKDTIGLDVIFPDYIKNNLTEIGIEVNGQLKGILKFAYISYDKSKIKFHRNEREEAGESKASQQKKISIGYQRVIPKAGKIVHIPAQISCLNCGKSLEILNKTVEKTVINLVFTKNGIRKSVINFLGAISYCKTCNIRYYPKEINKRGNQLFGHAFQSWIVYQRLVLRLSYKNIVKLMEEQFNEKVSLTTVTECIKSFADKYVSAQ